MTKPILIQRQIRSIMNIATSLSLFILILLAGCSSDKPVGAWDYEIEFEDGTELGTMKIADKNGSYQVLLLADDLIKREVESVEFDGKVLSGVFSAFNSELYLKGSFVKDQFKGEIVLDDKRFPILASRQSRQAYGIDRSHVEYILSETDLPASEEGIDHAGLIDSADGETLVRGGRIYNANCINCHGNPDVEGSIPLSTKFWKDTFEAGSDPFSMYQTLTRGFRSMPPQLTLTPQEKYQVIFYIQQKFIKKANHSEYVQATPGYLAGLPAGSSHGPAAKAYHPWSDMDYGNFLINTYEMVDDEAGPPRYHSPRPVPYADEDYTNNNFAYKGIAVRLDEGPGGVSKGNSWMIFDHDVMRVAGGWTGKGFIDWNAILLNDKHETYPRTVGKLHFETPVGPGWANPENGSFKDPRFRARDGRAFGPLPKSWSDYKGIYHHGDQVIISYTVGSSDILEKLGVEQLGEIPIFTRTLNLTPSSSVLRVRVAPDTISVAVSGKGLSLSNEDGFTVLQIESSKASAIKIFISGEIPETELVKYASKAPQPESLDKYTKGGPAHYPKVLSSVITEGANDGLFAIDKLTPPFDNPWDARMKLSGLDFLNDPNQAVACATDGDVWLISGLIENSGALTWKRIGSGLFQPLGIKVLDDNIYVTCRDQIALLRDLNGDDETDFYQSFNHDHQVTDHFHEFAMGLQADKQGNLYYAKSGRHAREALIPQHGTLIKVSPDGSKSEIIATGFRAANGVCINPDGSFIVTDQQGFWNPMNRINWVDGKDNFYGNMWGYNPPKDSSRKAMEPPMVWVDMEFDRSPSELLWIDSEKWGALQGHLLSFSYGYGKIQLVLNEKVNGQMQGGVIDLPGVKFLTGVMRGRFNPKDGHLYACGMSAWGTSQMMRGGGLYRLRYTGNPITLLTDLKVWDWGIELTFDITLDPVNAKQLSNYQLETWDLVRSSNYGSDRYNKKTLLISKIDLQPDGKRVKLLVNDITPIDVMTISYNLLDDQGSKITGTVQNTIHNLRKEAGI